MNDTILDFLLRNAGKAWKTKELARALHLARQGPEYDRLKAALRALQEAGEIERHSGGRWAAAGGEQTGEQETASEEERLVVGAVKEIRRMFFLEADDRDIREDIPLRKRRLNGARDGDKVVVRLTLPAHPHQESEAQVLEILGQRGHPDVEMLALAKRYGLSRDFPPDVDAQAHELPVSIPESEIAGRLDLRDEECFTIDPEDAKDFDDAVSLRLTESGYELGVHIADVSHYVATGTAMDREALRRGTSVYLVDGVFPMLPERLSNHICSLQEGKDRLTYSAIMQLSPRGAVRDLLIRKSVIRSRKRFSYDEVQHILDSDDGPHHETLRNMEQLANILMKKRFREGSVDFNLPEVAFRFDERGVPIEIHPKPRLMSMRMIEEFMLLANKSVAAAVHGIRPRRPFVFRVHDVPDPEKVGELLEFMRHLGVKTQLDATSSKSFQRMLEQIRGRPEENVIQDVTIRSMAKAIYSEKNIGHFGLGFQQYTHFTSPIRRYPDLLVHRLCRAYFGDHEDDGDVPTPQRVADIAAQSSLRERIAVEAERESRRIKQIEYMKRHEGDEFDAVIDGVMSYGLYAELLPTLVEGLIHIRSMQDDYYRYDRNGRRLVGERTGRQYRLGDTVRVQVARVDSIDRRIDLVLVDDDREVTGIGSGEESASRDRADSVRRRKGGSSGKAVKKGSLASAGVRRGRGGRRR
jgi:ribonuclease R